MKVVNAAPTGGSRWREWPQLGSKVQVERNLCPLGFEYCWTSYNHVNGAYDYKEEEEEITFVNKIVFLFTKLWFI